MNVKLRLRFKELNARGNGSQTTRRLRLPDGTTGWASDIAENVTGHWSQGTYLAADRNACQHGYVPVGSIVLDFETPFRGGSKAGKATLRAGVVQADENGNAKIKWGLATRRHEDDWQVQAGQEAGQEWLSV